VCKSRTVREDRRSTTDPGTLKKRLSPGLLDISGVSGVGISGGTLAVYLEVDSDAVRQAVEKVVGNETPRRSGDLRSHWQIPCALA
jgi:hypothetical protein